MAKKYLLYIHHEQFDREKKKSGLVNALLKKHYSTDLGKYGTFVEATLVPAQAFTKPKPSDERVIFCKHNAVIGFCKKGCKT